MDSYREIIGFIRQKLRKIQDKLEVHNIKNEIDNVKIILKTPLAKEAVFGKGIADLSDAEWVRIEKELEESFNVKMKQGLLIQGKEQQQRDSTWWTGKAQSKSENYYWSRCEEYLGESLPREVVRIIDVDTNVIMNNIENPKNENFDRRGMVVGHVQSGKTGNYSSLICKAADAGYKFIVVIAGGINNLRNQTQERLNESFIGKDGAIQVGVGRGDAQLNKLPISLTTKEKDFNLQDADRSSQGLNFDNISTPIVLIIKKHTRTLSNVTKWIESQYPNGVKKHAMLMIDDESDYASVNTGEEEDPKAINKKLRALLNLFDKSCYVAYTATPYANIFIDSDAEHKEYQQDLFPKDFIYALDAPTNYFGARKIFLDSDRRHLSVIDDYETDIPSDHKKDHELLTLPETLYEAIRVFILNVSIRNLRNQNDKHNSMLVHATRFTAVHQKIALHIDQYINLVKTDIHVYGMIDGCDKKSVIIAKIKNTFLSKYNKLEFSWDDVIKTLCDVVDTIIIREVHRSTSEPLEYRKDVVTNAIVVGGTSLSRGYTLEGLSVSYFLRNTVYYDTLMQMGRWFGYRSGYEDLCWVYMTESMFNNFAYIIKATEDLIDDFKRMRDENMTPSDFGLAVRYHPDSGLQVTARNKQKETHDWYFDMKLDGHLKDTGWLDTDPKTKEHNLRSIKNIVSILSINSKKVKRENGKFLWKDIDKTHVLNFLNDFKISISDPFGRKERMPISFIKEYVKEIDTGWDVVLYSGSGKKFVFSNDISIQKEERRKGVKEKGGKYEIRQVSSGAAESIVFSKDERVMLGSNRKNIRAEMKRPLLILHILDTEYDSELAAFSISFPGGIKSKGKTVRVKVNSVFMKNILSEESLTDD